MRGAKIIKPWHKHGLSPAPAQKNLGVVDTKYLYFSGHCVGEIQLFREHIQRMIERNQTVSDKGEKLAIKRIAYVVAPPMN